MAPDAPQPMNDIDALAAMANGADLDEKDPQAPGEALDEKSIDSILGAPAVPSTVQAAVAMPPVASGHRASDMARMQAMARQASAQQYKRFMMPLLLTVGPLLLALGAFALIFSGPVKTDANGGVDSSFTLGKDAWIYAVIALPLGLILLAGGWLFRSELRKAGK